MAIVVHNVFPPLLYVYEYILKGCLRLITRPSRTSIHTNKVGWLFTIHKYFHYLCIRVTRACHQHNFLLLFRLKTLLCLETNMDTANQHCHWGIQVRAFINSFDSKNSRIEKSPVRSSSQFSSDGDLNNSIIDTANYSVQILPATKWDKIIPRFRVIQTKSPFHGAWRRIGTRFRRSWSHYSLQICQWILILRLVGSMVAWDDSKSLNHYLY